MLNNPFACLTTRMKSIEHTGTDVVKTLLDHIYVRSRLNVGQRVNSLARHGKPFAGVGGTSDLGSPFRTGPVAIDGSRTVPTGL